MMNNDRKNDVAVTTYMGKIAITKEHAVASADAVAALIDDEYNFSLVAIMKNGPVAAVLSQACAVKKTFNVD